MNEMQLNEKSISHSMKFSFHTSYSRHSYLRIVVGMTLMKSHVIDCSDISTKLPSSELDELSRQDVY